MLFNVIPSLWRISRIKTSFFEQFAVNEDDWRTERESKAIHFAVDFAKFKRVWRNALQMLIKLSFWEYILIRFEA